MKWDHFPLSGAYKEALAVLKKALPSRKELVYSFAPSLITQIPSEVVELLIQLGNQLNPARLLPALALT